MFEIINDFGKNQSKVHHHAWRVMSRPGDQGSLIKEGDSGQTRSWELSKHNLVSSSRCGEAGGGAAPGTEGERGEAWGQPSGTGLESRELRPNRRLQIAARAACSRCSLPGPGRGVRWLGTGLESASLYLPPRRDDSY